MVQPPAAATGASINGETVSVYKINAGQCITIHGLISDCLKSLDAGFYIASMKDAPSAMTVDLIDLEFKKNDGSYSSFMNYDKFCDEVEREGTGVGAIAGKLMKYLLDDGLSRDGAMIYLTKFIDPRNITFNGIVPLNVTDLKNQPTIMDENPIYKELGVAAINTLLEERFEYKESGKTHIPTYAGLMALIKEGTLTPEEDAAAEETTTAILGKLDAVMTAKTGGTGYMTKSLSFLGEIKLHLPSVLAVFFNDRATLSTFLKTWKVKVEIIPYPYKANKDEYVTIQSDGSAVTNSNIKANSASPLYMWGIDVTTSTERK